MRRFSDEIYRLLIHGLLHLLGHDHVLAGERRAMERRGEATGRSDRTSVAVRRESLMHQPADERGKREPHYLPVDRSRFSARFTTRSKA